MYRWLVPIEDLEMEISSNQNIKSEPQYLSLLLTTICHRYLNTYIGHDRVFSHSPTLGITSHWPISYELYLTEHLWCFKSGLCLLQLSKWRLSAIGADNLSISLFACLSVCLSLCCVMSLFVYLRVCNILLLCLRVCVCVFH